jgi:hypothetical protein
MPQASNELRDLMDQYFGDRISDQGPSKFLHEKGYTEEGGWIKPPEDFKEFDESRIKEWHCVMFLIQEWDYAWNGPSVTSVTDPTTEV